MGKISQLCDDDEGAVNWIHDVICEGERLRIGLSQEGEHFIFKFRSRAVKVHYKDLISILVNEFAQDLEKGTRSMLNQSEDAGLGNVPLL